jgi:flagellar protein FlbD
MIEVTRLDDSKILVNAEMIQSLQATPDTVITLTTNGKMIVKEPVDEISRRILRYQRSMRAGLPYILRERNRSHFRYSNNTIKLTD